MSTNSVQFGESGQPPPQQGIGGTLKPIFDYSIPSARIRSLLAMRESPSQIPARLKCSIDQGLVGATPITSSCVHDVDKKGVGHQ